MAATILYGTRETTVSGATAEGEKLWVPLDDLERATGWHLTDEGLCLDAACVPIPPQKKSEWLDARKNRLDLAAFARHLGQPIVRDEASRAWSFGDATRSRVATGDPTVAPDFTLPDLDGGMHSLSDYRGKKVLLLSWASW